MKILYLILFVVVLPIFASALTPWGMAQNRCRLRYNRCAKDSRFISVGSTSMPPLIYTLLVTSAPARIARHPECNLDFYFCTIYGKRTTINPSLTTTPKKQLLYGKPMGPFIMEYTKSIKKQPVDPFASTEAIESLKDFLDSLKKKPGRPPVPNF